MKKLFLFSLFALTAGLYGDYMNPNSDQRGFQPLRQRLAQRDAGCPNYARGSAMPYTTIVDEDAQGGGARQQYYYYGSDRNQRSEDYDNDDEADNSALFNRGNIRENINNLRNNPEFRDRMQNAREKVSNNPELRDRLNNARDNLRGSMQGTYYNRSAQQSAANSNDLQGGSYFNRSSQATATAANDTFGSENDRIIGQRIRDAIKGGWFSKGYEQVNLDVNNGIVTIRGFVATLDDRRNVEDAVRRINGVNNIRNQLTVQANNPDAANTNATTRSGQMNAQDNDDDEDDEDDDDNDYPQDRAANASDQEINKRIRDAIGGGLFTRKFEGVVIRTDKGIVTLEGWVDSFDDQRKLSDETRKIQGVRSINNNVQVKNKSS